jgi:nucleoside-diphosphate-sugar epimerase
VSDELRRVLITGAAGRIGRAVAPQLPHDWDLRLTDLEESDGAAPLDITDLDACRAAFAGLDAVVHLAANPSPTATFAELLTPNIVGAYTVAQAAMDSGVRRLVFASSIHAMSGTDGVLQVRSADQSRPGNLYGATKAWAEALGAWVALQLRHVGRGCASGISSRSSRTLRRRRVGSVRLGSARGMRQTSSAAPCWPRASTSL